MENIELERAIYSVTNKRSGEVVWVSLDEKNIHVFCEDTGDIYIFMSSCVTNLVSSIDKIEDGQTVHFITNHMDEVVSAKFIFPEFNSVNNNTLSMSI